MDQHLTWAQLARLAGVRSPQVEELEGGTRDAQFTTVIKIASALGIQSIDTLLGPMPIERFKR